MLFQYLNDSNFKILHGARQQWAGVEWNHVIRTHIKENPDFFHRIYLMHDGEIFLKLKNGETRHLVKGKIYLVPQETIADNSTPESFDQSFIHFTSDGFFRKIFDSTANKLVIESSPFLEHQIDRIIKTHISKTVSDFFEAKASLYAVLAALLANLTEADIMSGKYSRFLPVISYIDDNYMNEISIKKLASLLYLDSTYFSNLFCQTFGQPPVQYILERRLNAARENLVSTTLPVNDIASQSGFNNESYFNRVFKSHTGLTPLIFRKRFLESLNY